MHQDAGSNPVSGKHFYFSMTRFVYDKFNFFLIEIMIMSPLNKCPLLMLNTAVVYIYGRGSMDVNKVCFLTFLYTI